MPTETRRPRMHALPSHNGGIDGNSVERFHKLSPCVFRLKRLAVLRAQP